MNMKNLMISISKEEENSNDEIDTTFNIDSNINYKIEEKNRIKDETYKLDSHFCNYKNPKLNKIIEPHLTDYIIHKIVVRIVKILNKRK